MTYFPFLVDGEGIPTPNPDYVLEVAESEDPFTVTYTLNPEAVWHSGDPITAADWHQNWVMLNGVDPSVNTVTTEGYELISSVEQGADEFQVVVTFCREYPDYESLFSPLLPASAIPDVATFNEGWVGDLPNDWFTGPFEVGSYDSALGIVDQVPSDTWWGEPPLLDNIIVAGHLRRRDTAGVRRTTRSMPSTSAPDPNGYALAYNTPGAEIRAAAGPNWRQITLNSGPNGGLIQDQVVRQAIQMSLDRGAIGESDLAGIPWAAKPLGNHVFVENNAAYVDNAGEFGTYNPDGARALLEENGWVLGDDGVYEKDGTRLHVRHSQIVGTPVSENEARLVQSQLAEVGIEVEIVDMSLQDWGNILVAGEFEMMAFTWIGTPFPYSGLQQTVGRRLGQQLLLLHGARDRPVDRPGCSPSPTRPCGPSWATRSTWPCGSTPTRSRCTSAPS